MQLQQFKDLDIDKKVEYINNELQKGINRAEIYRNIGIAKSTIEGQLSRNSYKFSKELNKFISKQDDESMTAVIDEKNLDIGFIEAQKDLKNNIINLANDYDRIQKVLKWFDNNSDDKGMTQVIEVINEGIKMNLPQSNKIRTTIRINESTWNRFKEFAEEHKEFNQQDLMAQALEDYMKKYK
ncbi:hypothetical protein [Terrisporobacter sp.]